MTRGGGGQVWKRCLPPAGVGELRSLNRTWRLWESPAADGQASQVGRRTAGLEAPLWASPPALGECLTEAPRDVFRPFANFSEEKQDTKIKERPLQSHG